jgi:putative membrane-bound dehydrogenase-like protein
MIRNSTPCWSIRHGCYGLVGIAVAACLLARDSFSVEGSQPAASAQASSRPSSPPKLTTDPKESEAMVGVAVVDVTPDYRVRLNGFGGRRTESDGVTQRIFVKALAIGDDPKSAAVLMTMDNLGIPDWMTREVGRRLQAKTGLDPERLTITFTHTHTAPMLRGASPTIFSAPIPPDHKQRIEKYTEQMTGWLEEAATKALASRVRSRLSWAIGRVGFAVNRRAGKGPVDHDLPVLVVHDLQGKVRAIYTTYACHCVTFGHNKISGDWAGYAAAALESEFPGATALVSIGCGADSNPDSGVTNGDVRAAARQGNAIRDEIKKLLAGRLRPIKAQPDVRYQRIDLPLQEPPPREFWDKRKKDPSGHVSLHAQAQLDRLDRGERLRTTVSYPVQTWCFGDDLAMVFLPGEVVVDYSLRLKSELVADRVWIHGYSNDFPFYIPSERVLREGGYEGGDAFIYFDMPAKFAPGLESRIIDAVHKQLPDTFNSPHDARRTGGTSPLSPQRSLESMRVRPGLKVELVAAEPLVVDPVAIDFGPDGKLWVAEMHDYPQGIDGNFKPGGRVKLLTDSDGDGRYDKATTFLDRLPFPTDVKVWRKGVLVCAAPDILYAEDTDGDGKADIVKKLFTGFATHNYQARVNSLQFGLDNWVYASSGLFGGKIKSFSGKTIDLTSRDFRMKPDTGVIESVTGQSQQGRVRDDWDNWFGCDSGQFIRHYPVVDRYVRRNPNVSPPATAVNVADYPGSNRLFPIAPLVTFKLSGPPGYATAACGLGIYRDDLLGAAFYGNSFTCEPVCQVVHRLVLTPKGATFSGRRAADEQQSEFLASSDNWFRPVQAKTGLDGALWVVDMYRYVIEHPIWIPPDVLATLDVRAGDQMGRIYRVVPADRPTRPIVRLDALDTPSLVASLDTPNGQKRDLVHQLLVWRGDRSAVAPLEKLARASHLPQVRAQAHCVLEGLGALSAEWVAVGLQDADAGVRRHAVRLIETLDAGNRRAVACRLSALADDPDPQVRLQWAYSLGEVDLPTRGRDLARLIVAHPNDEYLRAAALSSLGRPDVEPFLAAILAAPRTTLPLLESLSSCEPCVGRFDRWSAILRGVLDRDQFADARPSETQRWPVLAKLLETYDRRFAPQGEKIAPQLETRLATVFARAREIALDDASDVDDRMRAVRLLGVARANRAADREKLRDLLHPRQQGQLQRAALAQLARMNDEAIADLLLAQFAAYTPSIRGAVIDALLSRPAWTKRLLDEIEQKRIRSDELDAGRRQRLLQAGDMHQQQRAARLFAANAGGNRQEIVKEYAAAAALGGNRNRGRDVFAKRCAACHRLDGVGHLVGPDLAPLVHKSPQALLLAILDPNQAVDPRYVTYTALTLDGQSLSGILAGESAASITLAEQDGKQHVLLRSDIDDVKSTGKSLMPEGIERDIAPPQMADLLAYLAGAAAPPKTFAGVVPRTIKPDSQGAILLRANECEIRGPTLIFEPEFKNLGYWQSDDDSATWTIDVPRTGDFDVELDYACADDSGGNHFVLATTAGDLTGTAIRGAVAGTGGWNRYRTLRAGTIRLAAAAQSIVVRGEPPIRGALFDLRSIRLAPSQTHTTQAAAARDNKQTPTAATLAATILDEKASRAHREKAVAAALQQPAAVIVALAAGLPAHSAKTSADAKKEEYRRIPWIWRVAIAAGKRNDAAQIKELLAATLPRADEPLRDWQAVVLGGGVINGITQSGAWPGERIVEILKDRPQELARWNRAIELASAMADDEAVPHGTRYDALRMLGVDSWDRRGKQIVKYLAKGTNDELQMGAVSALGDMPGADATAALLDSFEGLSANNRNLALDALLRSDERTAALLDRLESRRIASVVLSERHVKRLKSRGESSLRKRAAVLFP